MKRINALNLIILLTILCLTLLATACGSAPAAPPPTSTATAISAAAATETAPVPTPEVSGTDEAVDESAEKKIQDMSAEDLAKIVTERTPVPSPTPDRVDKLVEQVAAESGLAGKTFLGLTAEDWITLMVVGGEMGKRVQADASEAA